MRNVLYILGQLTDADAEWLARHGKKLRLSDGEAIVNEGGAIDALYITLDGRFRVTLRDGREVAQLSAGDVIGEVSFVDFSPPLPRFPPWGRQSYWYCRNQRCSLTSPRTMLLRPVSTMPWLSRLLIACVQQRCSSNKNKIGPPTFTAGTSSLMECWRWCRRPASDLHGCFGRFRDNCDPLFSPAAPRLVLEMGDGICISVDDHQTQRCRGVGMTQLKAMDRVGIEG